MSKWMEGLRGVVCKSRVVQGMLFREPALRAERPAIVEEAWAAGEGEVGKMYMNLAVVKASVF